VSFWSSAMTWLKSKKPFGNALMLGGAVYSGIMLLIVMLVCGWHWREVGLSLAVVFAGATIGILVGFTFGIPKFMDVQADQVSKAKLVANSNFGRVSDWLTTIVIGLGIAQFGKVLDGTRALGNRFSEVFPASILSTSAASAYGICLVISSVGIGFVMMFMWTSTRLLEVYQKPHGDGTTNLASGVQASAS